jgi:hypothetical protein
MTRIGLAAMEDDAIYFKMVKKGSPEHIAAMGLPRSTSRSSATASSAPSRCASTAPTRSSVTWASRMRDAVGFETELPF